MQIGYLGPLEVRDGDRTVDVPGRRLRTLLGRLATDVGRPIPARTLIEALWPDDVPADPANALQSLVSRLRRALGDPTLVEQLPGGYRLNVRPEDVDAVRFGQLAGQGRAQLAAGSALQATVTLREALTLWRGQPLPDDDSIEAETVRVRLVELALQVRVDRIEADLATVREGGSDLTEVVAELEQLVGEHPLREDLAALRMRALVAAGRPAEALVAYENIRGYLADTLGSDPSAALQEQYLAVLRLQETSPALRRTNLRAAVTSFVGRDDDAARVTALLAGSGRLVTIVGAGGAGKTRLASEVAAGWLGRGRDGVWVVELAPVSDAGNVALAVLDGLESRELSADPLDRTERPLRTAHDRILEALADSDCLVLIDNCEHVVDAAAALVADILGGCPGVRLIATSREPLGIDGETLYPLSPLRLPDDGASVDEAAGSAAVQLLLDRSRAAGAQLVLDDSTVADVVAIVRRLDGLPLAIELAAARLRVMSVDEIATRLGDRFRLLTGGRRTAMPRHRTLRAVVEWSWDLLSPLEREVAERFAVFGSGASAEAVAAICPGPDPAAIEDLLHALVDKSLLVPVQNSGEPRFRMLETLREYGSERLTEHGELTPTLAAHAAYFARLAGLADPGLRSSEQVGWLRRLDADRDNLLSALAWLGEHDQAAAAIDMSVCLTWYWMLRENGKDAARWLKFALDSPGAASSPMYVVAEALHIVSWFASPGDADGGEERRDVLLAMAARLEPALGLHPLVAMLRPLLYFFADERALASALTDANIDADDRWVRAAALTIRMAFRENDGDVEGMREDLAAALPAWEALGDHWGLATTLASQGQLHTLDGDVDAAAADYEAALAHLRTLGSTTEDLLVNIRLADLRLRAGDFVGARRYADAVRGLQTSEDPAEFGDGRSLLGDAILAGIALEQGDTATVDRMAVRIRAVIELTPGPSLYYSHAISVACALMCAVSISRGDLVAARDDAAESIRHGRRTRDLPILATAGVAVAAYATAIGKHQQAATVLGAAARLRGADDLAAPVIARLTRELRATLGDEFEAAYGKGRGMDRDEAMARLDLTLLD